jgi:hypothetical protein
MLIKLRFGNDEKLIFEADKIFFAIFVAEFFSRKYPPLASLGQTKFAKQFLYSVFSPFFVRKMGCGWYKMESHRHGSPF